MTGRPGSRRATILKPRRLSGPEITRERVDDEHHATMPSNLNSNGLVALLHLHARRELDTSPSTLTKSRIDAEVLLFAWIERMQNLRANP
jgi:hypothetical protein